MSDLKEFKGTGVYWLPEIPNEWIMRRAWQLFSQRKTLGDSEAPALVPSRHYGVVTQEEYSKLANRKPTDNERTKHMMTEVKPGDFVISMGSFESGIEFSQIAGKVSNHYKVLVPHSGVIEGYFRWLFKSRPLIDGIAGLAVEIRVGQEIHYSKFAKLSLPLPPLETQRRIADYLDVETEQIDTTVSTLDELIEEMKSRRVQLIQESVSGSDSYVGSGEFAEINPSSHEGMSEFPQVPLGVLCHFQAGGTPTSTNSAYWVESGEEGIPWVSIADMSGTDLVESTAKGLSDDGMEALGIPLSPAGTVLFAMYASVGKVSTLGIPAVWNQALLGLTPDRKRLESRFLAYALKTLEPILPMYFRSNTQDNLNAEVVKKLRIPLPPLETQQRIADYLDAETVKIDKIISTATELRSELLARRSALITEVVTGQRQV